MPKTRKAPETPAIIQINLSEAQLNVALDKHFAGFKLWYEREHTRRGKSNGPGTGGQ